MRARTNSPRGKHESPDRNGAFLRTCCAPPEINFRCDSPSCGLFGCRSRFGRDCFGRLHRPAGVAVTLRVGLERQPIGCRPRRGQQRRRCPAGCKPDCSGALGGNPFLAVESPFPCATVLTSSSTTLLDDASLSLSGLTAACAATTTNLGSGIKLVSQVLGSGAFEIYNTDNSTLLLEGTIHDSVITGILGSSSGSVLSADVTYTGGAISECRGLSDPDGRTHLDLAGTHPLVRVSIPQPGTSTHFNANATGQFMRSRSLVRSCCWSLAAGDWLASHAVAGQIRVRS